MLWSTNVLLQYFIIYSTIPFVSGCTKYTKVQSYFGQESQTMVTAEKHDSASSLWLSCFFQVLNTEKFAALPGHLEQPGNCDILFTKDCQLSVYSRWCRNRNLQSFLQDFTRDSGFVMVEQGIFVCRADMLLSQFLMEVLVYSQLSFLLTLFDSFKILRLFICSLKRASNSNMLPELLLDTEISRVFQRCT